MRNILKILAFSTIVGLILNSCGEEPYDIEDGGKLAANMTATPSVSYFAGVTTDVTVDLDLFTNTGVTVSEIKYTVQLVAAEFGKSTVATFTANSSSTNISHPIADLYAALPVDGNVLEESDLSAGDSFVFNYYLTLSDGSELDLAANTVVEFLCLSTLAGDFTYSTVGWCGNSQTGTASWVEVGDGIYETVDFTYGAYLACYNWTGLPEGTLQIKDTCGKLEPLGASQWGEIYWYNSVSVNGADLTIDWENDYGEAGVVTLTRTDGENWPENLRN